MDDILRADGAPYKSCKSVGATIERKSDLRGSVLQFALCYGHIFFYNSSIRSCSIYQNARTDDVTFGKTSTVYWMFLNPRLKRMFSNKNQCERHHSYPEEQNIENSGNIYRDVYDGRVYHDI